MTVVLRQATATDAKQVASLLTELGYPSTETEVQDRVAHALRSDTSCLLVALSGSEAAGLMCAELVPYFPTGGTVCRVTSLVVAARHRGRGLGRTLLAGAAEFARQHRCSGIELTSAERRVEAHRFYQRLGFSRTGFRFFQSL
jgi:ribosomal protein S18 acetylase RimI-like enzyme